MKHIVLIFLVVLFFFIVLTRCGVGVNADYPEASLWNDKLYLGTLWFVEV